MKIKLFIISALILTSHSFAASETQTNHFPTATDSQSIRQKKVMNLVNKAIALYHKHGLQETIRQLGDRTGPWCTQYKYGYFGINLSTTDGDFLASCKLPGLVGHNILGWKSPDGEKVSQEFLKDIRKNPEGLLTTAGISNFNPMIGKPSGRKYFAKQINGLIFFGAIYNDTPLHADVIPAEDIEKLTNPQNAKKINLSLYPF